MLRDIEVKQRQVEQSKERIPELERAPVFALAHADRQLRLRVRAEEDEPVFMTTVGESVESCVQAALETTEQQERLWERDVELAEDVLAREQVHLHELTKVRALAELEVGIAKSLVDANQADFERLTKLRDQLEGLEGRCDHGNVEFSACQHIQERKSAVTVRRGRGMTPLDRLRIEKAAADCGFERTLCRSVPDCAAVFANL